MEKVTMYTTIENQIREDGSYGLLYDHFTDYNAALAKLYTILAAAAVSGLPYHSGHVLRDDGIITDGRVFDRRIESTATKDTITESTTAESEE